jgi:DNA polymerase IIIc chi subunit
MSNCIFHDTDSTLRERRLFEIVEKAFGRREKVVIYTQTEERAAVVDRVLWINRQEAFVPHEVFLPDGSIPSELVIIVTREVNPIGARLLVADGQCSLEYSSSFDMVHEFVDRSSPRTHETCRERFRSYRARQFQVDYSK